MTHDDGSSRGGARTDSLSTADLLDDLGRRSIRSGAVRVGAQAVQVVLAVAGGAILARILTPGDFGVFAMALSVIGFIMWVRDFGLPLAATQRESLDHGQASALFRISLALSALMALLVLVTAPAVADFYDEPRLVGVLAVMAAATLVGGISIVPEGVLIRGMRFAPLATVEVAAAVASLVAGLSVALLGGGYWALVAQHAALVSMRSIGITLSARWRPSLRVDGASVRAARGMLRYGGQLTLTRVLQYFALNTDRIVLGYYYGSQTLGLYDNSYRWSRYPVRQVFGPLRNVIVSALSRLQRHDRRFRAAFARSGVPVFTVSVPALAYMAVDTPTVILAVLGEQWTEAVPMFRFLTLSALAAAVRGSLNWAYLSEGRTRHQLGWELVSAPIMIGAIFIGLRVGPLGVAIAHAAASWLLIPPGVWYCTRDSRLRVGDLVSAWWRPFVAASAGVVVLYLWSPALTRAVTPGTGELAALGHALVRGSAFLAIYAMVWLTLPGARERLDDLHAIVRHLKPGGPSHDEV
ncbi:MAG: lipopolysaccharide biosynthesis protein [Gemmatimonadota bacterium]|nr:lipopolysaccharide biosynthesis protein [Gemmatimonadota bacterium]